MRRNRSTALALTAAMGVGLLAGCAPASDAPASPEAASQTVQEACVVVADGMQKVQSEIEGLATDMQGGDLSGVGDVMASMRDTLGDLLGDVENADVNAAVTEMHDALTEFTASLDGATSLGDLASSEAFVAAGEKMQAAGSEFASLCSDDS
jgi:hypothetical protein